MKCKKTFGECLDILLKHKNKIPIDTVHLAQDLGLNVYRVNDWDDSVSGKIQKDSKLGGESGYAIFVNGRHSEQRRRFTIAHEIAHFILHASLIGDGICDDALYRSNKGHYIETEANQMAADILMPLCLIRNHMNEGARTAKELSEIFNVSENVMKIRIRIIKNQGV